MIGAGDAPSGHPAGDLPLYALGALDDAGRAAVDAHVATCAACATDLGSAEAAVFALDGLTVASANLPASPFARPSSPSERRSRRPAPAFAALAAPAAALLFGLGFGTGHVVATRSGPAREDAALETIAGSHFLHVTLSPVAPGAPATKAIYARDGAWLYAIVDGAADAYRLRVLDLTRGERIDSFAGDGAVGTLFEPRLARPPVAVELVRVADGATVARATIVYPAPARGR